VGHGRLKNIVEYPVGWLDNSRPIGYNDKHGSKGLPFNWRIKTMSNIFICTVETSALENFMANNTGHNIPAGVVAFTFACDSKTNEIIGITGDTGDGSLVDIEDVIYDMAKPSSHQVLQPLIDTAKANCTTSHAPGFISFNRYNG
jgi:hypothetical protein